MVATSVLISTDEYSIRSDLIELISDYLVWFDRNKGAHFRSSVCINRRLTSSVMANLFSSSVRVVSVPFIVRKRMVVKQHHNQ